jgi:hypothetical protein
MKLVKFAAFFLTSQTLASTLDCIIDGYVHVCKSSPILACYINESRSELYRVVTAHTASDPLKHPTVIRFFETTGHLEATNNLNRLLKESIEIESLSQTLSADYLEQFVVRYLNDVPVSGHCRPPLHFPNHPSIVRAVERTVTMIFKCLLIGKKPSQLMQYHLMFSFVSHLLNVFQNLSSLYSSAEAEHVDALLFYGVVYRYLIRVCQHVNWLGVQIRGDSTEPTLYNVSLLPDYDKSAPFTVKRWPLDLVKLIKEYPEQAKTAVKMIHGTIPCKETSIPALNHFVESLRPPEYSMSEFFVSQKTPETSFHDSSSVEMTGLHPAICITVKRFLIGQVCPADLLSVIHSLSMYDLLTGMVHGSLLRQEIVESSVVEAGADVLMQFKSRLMLYSNDKVAASAFLVDFDKLLLATTSIMNLFIRHQIYFQSDDFSMILSGDTLVEWIAKCVRLCEDKLGTVSGASNLSKQFKELFKTAVPIMRRWGVDFDESLLHRVIRSIYT